MVDILQISLRINATIENTLNAIDFGSVKIALVVDVDNKSLWYWRCFEKNIKYY